MKISVIIPTYNRVEKLKKCLEAVFDQIVPSDAYEVHVVNNASTDATSEFLSSIQDKYPNLFVHNLDRKGVCYARNYAIDKSKGEILLFINDDTYIKNNFIYEHLESHKKHFQRFFGVLGQTLWHPDLKVTPFMEWLTTSKALFGKFGGTQFAYDSIKGDEAPDFRFFYTSNVSIKRSFLGDLRFDEGFNQYGWEDSELGYRLEKNGLRLKYNPDAIAFHDHEIKFNNYSEKQESSGKSAKYFAKLHPESNIVPTGMKLKLFSIISSPISIGFFLFLKLASFNKFAPVYWYTISKAGFLRGLNSK